MCSFLLNWIQYCSCVPFDPSFSTVWLELCVFFAPKPLTHLRTLLLHCHNPVHSALNPCGWRFLSSSCLSIPIVSSFSWIFRYLCFNEILSCFFGCMPRSCILLACVLQPLSCVPEADTVVCPCDNTSLRSALLSPTFGSYEDCWNMLTEGHISLSVSFLNFYVFVLAFLRVSLSMHFFLYLYAFNSSGFFISLLLSFFLVYNIHFDTLSQKKNASLLWVKPWETDRETYRDFKNLPALRRPRSQFKLGRIRIPSRSRESTRRLGS